MVNQTTDADEQKKQSQRNTMIIAGTAVALLLAAFMIYNFVMGDQPKVTTTITVPVGSSEKEQAMKGQDSAPTTSASSADQSGGGSIGDNVQPPTK